MTYQLLLHENHPIIKPNEQTTILIDSGSPVTFHQQNQVNFEGSNYLAHIDKQGINVNVISTLAGIDITTLLGADIMSQYKICLDYNNLTIAFEPLAYEIEEGDKINVEKFMGNLMLLPVQINGQSVLGYLDTGAKLSYASNQLTNGLAANENLEADFYIGLGAYETNTFNTNATLSNGFTYEGKFGGQLPAQLASSFFGGQKQAIIGSDFFHACKKVWLDYSNSCIYIVTY